MEHGIRVFDYYGETPSLSNCKMTDESRKLAEDNYKLFLYMFSSCKKEHSIIAESDFDDNIDIFYLCYCKTCCQYVEKRESKRMLSTYIGQAFRSICEHAIRHYNAQYMRSWRNNTMIPLDKIVDDDLCLGDVIMDSRTNIVNHVEARERLRDILEYVDTQIQTAKPNVHLTCSGWLILKLWLTNEFSSMQQFLEYLRYEGLATDDATVAHIRKILSHYRKKLKEVSERGEV